MALGAISAVLVGVAGRSWACSSSPAAVEPDLFPIRSPFDLAVRKHRGSDTHHVRLEGEFLGYSRFFFPRILTGFFHLHCRSVRSRGRETFVSENYRRLTVMARNPDPTLAALCSPSTPDACISFNPRAFGFSPISSVSSRVRLWSINSRCRW